MTTLGEEMAKKEAETTQASEVSLSESKGTIKRVAIVTSGSRGDTQPYIALALELKKRGYEVVLATEERMRELVEEFKLEFFPIAGDPTALIYGKESQDLLAKGHILQIMKKVGEHNAQFEQQALIDYEKACEGADLIVSGPLCMTATYCIAEKLRVPWVPVLLGPTLATGDYPLYAITTRNLYFRALNKATYSIVFSLLWSQERKKINTWRQEKLKLPPMSSSMSSIIEQRNIPVIVGCNRNLIPFRKKPADWLPAAALTGFLYVPKTSSEEVDPQLVNFVENAGSELIYLGFGSMPCPDPLEMLKWGIAIVEATAMKAVMVAGWSELSKPIENGEITIPETMFLTKAAPHDWLFPRVIVHHGGVGTSAAVLRAGVPSVPCPFMLDQPFITGVLHELGVATKPVLFSKLKREQLIADIKHAATSTEMRARAEEVAKEIAAEDGAAAACDVILNAPNTFLAA